MKGKNRLKCDEIGLRYTTFSMRIKRGWSAEEAMNPNVSRVGNLCKEEKRKYEL